VRAPILATHFGQAPIEELLDIHGFNLDAILEIEPDFLTDVDHEHDDEVTSFVFHADRPFDGIRLEEFFTRILKTYGAQLMRYKGVIAVQGQDRRVVLQGVHMLFSNDLAAPWSSKDGREGRIVFIGRQLPKAMLVSGLQQCLAEARLPE